MRLASFAIPYSGGTGDLSVIQLGGDGGGLMSYVNRWRGQLNLGSIELFDIEKDIVKEKGQLNIFKTIQIINQIKINDSPDWLKNKLSSLSMKSINVVVDLANYIMLMFGQPIHIFDFDKLPNKKIKVGYPENKKSLITLDSIKRKLSNDNLLI